MGISEAEFMALPIGAITYYTPNLPFNWYPESRFVKVAHNKWRADEENVYIEDYNFLTALHSGWIRRANPLEELALSSDVRTERGT